MRTFNYTLQDALGIHARPAGMLVKEAAKYSCAVQLHCNDKLANARKVFAVLGLEARCGDTLQVTCTGDDEDIAAQELQFFLSQHL